MNVLLISIEKLRLNIKLLLGFSFGLLIAAVIGFNSLVNQSETTAEVERLYDADLLGISHLKEANINLIYMGRSLRQAMIAQDGAARDKARAQVDTARTTLQRELAEAKKRIVRKEALDKYEEFLRNFNKYNENVVHALALLERERISSSEAAKFISSTEFSALGLAADETIDAITRIKEQGSRQTLDALRERAAQTRQTAILLLVIGVILMLGIGMLIGLSIQGPNERLRHSVEELAAGKVDAPIPHTDYPNEIGIMARAIAVLQDIYRKANAQHWVKSHASEISTELQQAEDFRALTQTAVSKIAPAIGAGHGAFYVLEGDGRFNLLASYGYRERKHLNSSFAVGEGLVGQCAMEKVPIMLTAPKDYIRINSGLGEGPPACIIVQPIIHGNRVLGVLEMASFQQFNEREQSVLDALQPVLAASMEILDRNLKTRELLAATQEQAERMEKQAAQLEEQQVEMEAQQAELLETENWFRSIIESAPDGMLVADAAGQILLTNPEAEKIFGYEPGELVGGQIEQLVPDRVRDRHPALRAQFMNEERTRAMGAGPKLTGRRKDGSEVPVTITLSGLPPRGARGKCVSVSVRRIAS
ncbi:MAG: PAS domain S-box protein [Sulfuritalea sp.]|jgi:two-component system sensor histidine kinase/response regulator|nr:PAS domain S-box protein [Sulfuritalea sp.]